MTAIEQFKEIWSWLIDTIKVTAEDYSVSTYASSSFVTYVGWIRDIDWMQIAGIIVGVITILKDYWHNNRYKQEEIDAAIRFMRANRELVEKEAYKTYKNRNAK